MIIVQKVHSGPGYRHPGLALCEEVRRTEARIYVTVIETGGFGYGGVVQGRTPNQYVDIRDVLSWNANEAMFTAMLAVIKETANRVDDLQRQIRATHENQDGRLRDLGKGVESLAIQESYDV